MRTRQRLIPALALAVLPAIAWLGFGPRTSHADSEAPGLCADGGDPYTRCDGGAAAPNQVPTPGPVPSPSPVPSPTFTGPSPGPTPSPTFTSPPAPTPSPSPSPAPSPPAFDAGF
jgi:hypothetical protein